MEGKKRCSFGGEKHRAPGHRGASAGRLWAVCGLCALLLAGTVWICADHLFGGAARRLVGLSDTSSSLIVTVPDLVGQVFTDGAMADTDLFDVSVTYVYGDQPARRILSQEPAPGVRRKVLPEHTRCTLRLTVSMGAHILQVPPLVGLDGREAEGLLRDQGFAVHTVNVHDADPDGYDDDNTGTLHAFGESVSGLADGQAVGLGQVLATDPPAGTQLPAGSEIGLYVFSGQDTPSVLCPDLTGLSRTQAEDALREAGLSVGHVTAICQPGGVPSVSSQDHVPGTWLPAGTEVSFTVILPTPCQDSVSPEESNHTPWWYAFPWW